jgi:hypothetical protein
MMPKLPDDQSPVAPTGDAANKTQPNPSPQIRHRVRHTAAPPATGERKPDPSRDYAVGYCRPPKHTRFKPGQSGNPKGRPKGARSLSTIVRELMSERVAVRTPSGEKKIHRIDALMRKLFELAAKGNGRALAQLLSLYAAAVPESVVADGPASTAGDELTATDLQLLEELKASWREEESAK